MKSWLQKNWREVLLTTILSFVLTSLLTAVTSIIKTFINNETFWNNLKNVLSINISLPIWVILLVIVGVSTFLLVLKRNKERLIENNIVDTFNTKVEKRKTEYYKPNNSQIHKAIQGFNHGFIGKFLGADKGTFSIWAYVGDIHNQIQINQRYMYIISYATNKGNELGNPNLATYPNAWAILRVSPTPNDGLGTWRFWCNNIDKEITNLDYTDPLSGGWHLFSVSWSRTDDYIKFIIDDRIVQETKFRNWPSDLSAHCSIGTWPNKKGIHFFDSKIGPWVFHESGYSTKLINNIFKDKPE